MSKLLILFLRNLYTLESHQNINEMVGRNFQVDTNVDKCSIDSTFIITSSKGNYTNLCFKSTVFQLSDVFNTRLS